MIRKTLLELTNSVLRDLRSDKVNSIYDTTEAMDIASIIQESYEYLMANSEWEHLQEFINLHASSDPNQPTTLLLPENVAEVCSLKYDIRDSTHTQTNYRELQYMDPIRFINYVQSRNTQLGNVVDVVDPIKDVHLYIYNNQMPTYWTCVDNKHIILDSWDSAVENTIQEHKTQVYAKVFKPWQMVDTFIPDLPPQMFPYLVSEATRYASVILNSEENTVAGRRALAGSNLMRTRHRRHNGKVKKGYGRR